MSSRVAFTPRGPPEFAMVIGELRRNRIDYNQAYC